MVGGRGQSADRLPLFVFDFCFCFLYSFSRPDEASQTSWHIKIYCSVLIETLTPWVFLLLIFNLCSTHIYSHYIISIIFTRPKHYEQRVKEINGINIGKWLLAHWRTISGTPSTPTPSNWDMYKVNISGEESVWTVPGVGGARRIIVIDHVCN